MLRQTCSLLLLSAVACCPAIVIRHDRDDAKYQALAAKYKSVVCRIPTGGHGTLVDPQWVLTAAHVVQEVSPFLRYVTFGDEHVPVSAVYLHPSWGSSSDQWNDIALVKLERPVNGIEHAKLYEKSDEAGKEIVFVGTGYTGDGNTGPTKLDRVWRAAQNVITSADPHRINFKFDRPPAGSDLEGISGPGDSGGPALLEVDDELYILGTSSDNSAPRGNGHCTYETTEHYGRVSTALGWIRQTMKSGGKGSDVFGLVTKTAPTSEQGKIARAYIDSLNAPDGSAYVAFSDKYWMVENLADTPASERKAMAERAQADYGRHEVLAWVERPARVHMLVRTERKGLVSLELVLRRGEELKMMGVRRVELPFEPKL